MVLVGKKIPTAVLNDHLAWRGDRIVLWQQRLECQAKLNMDVDEAALMASNMADS